MVSVQQIGSVAVIRLQSALLGEGLKRCKLSFEDCLAKRQSQVILDLTESPLINSEGLEFVVESQEKCLSRGGQLVLCKPQELCQTILEITGLDGRVGIYTDTR